MLHMIRVMNMLPHGNQRHGSSYTELWRNIIVFVSPPRFLTEKWVAMHLICQGDQVHLPSLSRPPLSSFLQSLPLIGRDSHHMCGGKVMGGMAALISERLPADKANGCGEAWASALPCNKHFHFVWLEWRMEWWKWWIWTTWGTEEGGGADR